LLSYYSEFFDAVCYEKFREANSETIELPAKAPEAIVALLSWIYSGTIESDLPPEYLWILGDRLKIPKFCNAVMTLLFGIWGCSPEEGGHWISAPTTDFFYRHTNKDITLQCFINHIIESDGYLALK
jgi:hypothetical protein